MIEMWKLDPNRDDGVLVKVEPVAELDVNYDSGPFYVKGLGELPYGKYAIVRLEATDE